MTAGPSADSLAAPVLVVRTRNGVHRLRPGAVYHVGRDPAADIVVDEPRVSWRHAVIRPEQGHWTIEDVSTNGTYLDGRRITRMAIAGERVFLLGNAVDGPALACSAGEPAAPPAPGASAPHAAQHAPPRGPRVDRNPSQIIRVAPRAQQAPRTLRIGRAPDNDIVVADLVVSRYHAELRMTGPGRCEIVDLGSHNGTYVNGVRVQSSALTEHDLLGIGHATYRLVGQELREFLDTGDVSVQVQDITVRTGDGKVIMDRVAFPIPERSLVAVIGPSGAGKSTLLGAVTGMRPATEGTVRYDNRDLYSDYDELRHRIGLVPQEDILHTQLATRQALLFAAELRFPGDTRKDERERRVDEVLQELGLAPHAKTRIDRLSGGQRKRVSVALELLTKPSLLFLDEPTSGLDPGLDKTVMEMLKGLAHDGRTVIVVTHSVANLDTCDRLLVLVPGGKLAYYGPPAEGLAHFGKQTWAEVFQAFDREPNRDWAAEFRNSPRYTRYVASGMSGGNGHTDARTPSPPPPQQSRFGQLSTLCRRYLAVIASDRAYLALIGVMPLLLGGLIVAIPSDKGLAGPPGTNPDASSKLMVLVFAACFVGAGNAIRELVKERTIYQRERAAGLSAAVYLMSKLLVLGVITAIQAVVLVGVGLLGTRLPDSGIVLPVLPELMIEMAVLGGVSLALGLLLSASVSTSEKTLPLLIVSSMGQLVLCGALVALNGTVGLEQLAWISPSRWGMGAAAGTIDLGVIQQGVSDPDPLWKHDQAHLLTNLGLDVALGLVFVVLTWWRLERLRPRRR
ncbi:FHA domain-containing protein [Actinomadura macrotermitis]|uniref:ABC transporter ATP-binding/permease protein n=1 Tax=Actinomadura macrotermitis TaxID=2585200 RepID=A0A7K0C0J5_9ACTN|nr:FHA domain-containing protein [Actinomadura macrotermitis]MQY06592.1 ABC transporter ATP-binding/permease protein [Actinomadura macrotermitis]